MNPTADALALSMGEEKKPRVLDRIQPELRLNPGYIGSRPHDDEPNGAGYFYAAYGIARGTSITKVGPKTTDSEFPVSMNGLGCKTPHRRELRDTLENLNVLKTPGPAKWQKSSPPLRFQLGHPCSSWLSEKMGWFAQTHRPSLCQGVFAKLTKVKREIERFSQLQRVIYLEKSIRLETSSGRMFSERIPNPAVVAAYSNGIGRNSCGWRW